MVFAQNESSEVPAWYKETQGLLLDTALQVDGKQSAQKIHGYPMDCLYEKPPDFTNYSVTDTLQIYNNSLFLRQEEKKLFLHITSNGITVIQAIHY